MKKQSNDQNLRSRTLADGLGWFSIGLGLTQIIAPRRLSRMIGVNEHPILMRVCGVREIVSGLGILGAKRPAAGLWSRVAGDAMDLALLGVAVTSSDAEKRKIIGATLAVAGVTCVDTVAAVVSSKQTPIFEVSAVMTVNCSPEEAYGFWRDLNNAPRYMKYIESVRSTDEKRSHWVGSGPFGIKVEWDAEITSDRPNEAIEWRSLKATVPISGAVTFRRASGGRGTEVRSEMRGPTPSAIVKEDLRRFKQLLETGEIPTTEGQSAGPSSTAVVGRVVQRLEGKEAA